MPKPSGQPFAIEKRKDKFLCTPFEPLEQLSEEEARERAASVWQKARERKAPRIPPAAVAAAAASAETLEKWTARWLAAREARDLTSVSDDAGRLKKWVIPYLGADSAVATIGRDELKGMRREAGGEGVVNGTSRAPCRAFYARPG